MKEALSSSGGRSAAILQALHDCVLVVDRKGEVLEAHFCPRVVSSLWGCDRFEALASNIRDCFVGMPFEQVGDFAPPSSSFEGGTWTVRGVPIREQSGEIRSIALSFNRRDTLEESFARLRSQLHEYERIFLKIRQGIWRVDQNGKIQTVNPYLAAWLECDEGSLVGRKMSDFLVLSHPAPDPQQSPISERFEAEFITASGRKQRAIVVRTILRDPKGKKCGCFDVITDMTAEHAAQTRLVEEVQRMAHLASLDPLTGVDNRRSFDLNLQSYMQEADERPFGVMVFDVDNLKEINDSYGHVSGDIALAEFAKRLKQGIRSTDHVARLGGDEFACLCPNVNRSEFSEAVRRLQSALNFEITIQENIVPIRVSIGCAHSQDGVEEIVRSADKAMYAQKRQNAARAAS